MIYENEGMMAIEIKECPQVQVICLGTSHMAYGVSPLYLYQRDGISAINLASGSQPLDVTHYYIREIYNNHINPECETAN